MRIITLLAFSIMDMAGGIAQDHLYLINTHNQMLRRIKNESIVSLGIYANHPDSTGSFYDVYSGKLIKNEDHKITIKINKHQFEYERGTGGVTRVEDYWGDAGPLKTFESKDILWIEHERKIFGIAAGLSTIGLIAAGIVAPLASISYQEGEMNANTYFAFASAGLGAAAFGTILTFIPGTKKYYFSEEQRENQRIWEIYEE